MSYAINEIVTGDARQLAPSIADGSIDLVFCDPIYQNIEDYAWLAQTALRVLKPGGVCLAWCSVPNAAPCQQAMERAGLGFVYWLFYTVTAKTWRLNRYQLFCWTTPCLWLRKSGEDMQLSGWIPDTYHDNTVISAANPQGSFTWNKNTSVLIKWIEQFSRPGDLIYDPFAGTGSIPIACRMTDRRFLASEILPERADEARSRLAATPAYMFAGDAA